MLQKTEGTIKNGHSIKTGNIGQTRHRTKSSKAQHRNLRRSATRTSPKTAGEPMCSIVLLYSNFVLASNCILLWVLNYLKKQLRDNIIIIWLMDWLIDYLTSWRLQVQSWV